jgi:hypothetical protein
VKSMTKVGFFSKMVKKPNNHQNKSHYWQIWRMQKKIYNQQGQQNVKVDMYVKKNCLKCHHQQAIVIIGKLYLHFVTWNMNRGFFRPPAVKWKIVGRWKLLAFVSSNICATQTFVIFGFPRNLKNSTQYKVRQTFCFLKKYKLLDYSSNQMIIYSE